MANNKKSEKKKKVEEKKEEGNDIDEAMGELEQIAMGAIQEDPIKEYESILGPIDIEKLKKDHGYGQTLLNMMHKGPPKKYNEFSNVLSTTYGYDFEEQEEPSKSPSVSELVQNVVNKLESKEKEVELKEKQVELKEKEITLLDELVTRDRRARSHKITMPAHEFMRILETAPTQVQMRADDLDRIDKELQMDQRNLKGYIYFSDYFDENGLVTAANILVKYRKPDGLKNVDYEQISRALFEMSSKKWEEEYITERKHNLEFEIEEMKGDLGEDVEEVKQEMREYSKETFPDKGDTIGYHNEISSIEDLEYLDKSIEKAIKEEHGPKSLASKLARTREKHQKILNNLETVQEMIYHAQYLEEKAAEEYGYAEKEKELKDLEAAIPVSKLKQALKNRWIVSNVSPDNLKSFFDYSKQFVDNTIEKVSTEVDDNLSKSAKNGIYKGKGLDEFQIKLTYIPESVEIKTAEKTKERVTYDVGEGGCEINLSCDVELEADGTVTDYNIPLGSDLMSKKYDKAVRDFLIITGKI